MDKSSIENMYAHLKRMEDALEGAKRMLMVYKEALADYKEAKAEFDAQEDKIDEAVVEIFKAIRGD